MTDVYVISRVRCLASWSHLRVLAYLNESGLPRPARPTKECSTTMSQHGSAPTRATLTFASSGTSDRLPDGPGMASLWDEILRLRAERNVLLRALGRAYAALDLAAESGDTDVVATAKRKQIRQEQERLWAIIEAARARRQDTASHMPR